MEVRNAVLTALLIDLAAVAAVLAPGAGSLVFALAGIAVSVSGALLLLAGLSWKWQVRPVVKADTPAATTSLESGSDSAALAG